MSDPVNILVVDDLATQRLTVEAALADVGERIVSVGSGREALKFLLENEAAVILLDVNMPEMDGFETATFIRQRQRNDVWWDPATNGRRSGHVLRFWRR